MMNSLFTRRRFLQLLGLGAVSMGTAAGYAFGYEPLLRLETRNYDVQPKNWKKGLNLRVAIIADVHACEPWMSAERIDAICKYTNDLGADIILLLGDYAAATNFVTDYIPPDIWSEILGQLKAPLGVHAVMGNHDWWEDKTAQEMRGGDTFGHRALRRAGINVFSNNALKLKKEEYEFWLAGLESQWAMLPSEKHGSSGITGLDDLQGTMSQIDDNDPVILMAHEPDIFPQVPNKVSLTLSGHTHGGQINFFGFAPYVPSRFGRRYVYGHIVENEQDLVVSGGLGCSILPVRFGSPPEIVVVDVS